MDPPLHSGVKSAVSWMNSSRWKLSKATKDANISRQSFGCRILECAKYFLHRLPWEPPIYYIALFVFEGRICTKKKKKKKKKKSHKWRRKSALLPRQCTVSQVDHNDGKTTWTALWIASAPTLFSRPGPQWLLAVCRPQKNATGERDLAPTKKWYRKLRRILKLRQIVLQKRHCIVREVLESE